MDGFRGETRRQFDVEEGDDGEGGREEEEADGERRREMGASEMPVDNCNHPIVSQGDSSLGGLRIVSVVLRD